MTTRASSMLLAAAFVAASVPAVGGQQVGAPSVRIGDYWEFESTDDWTNQVRYVERQEIVGVLEEFVRVRTDSKARNAKTGAMEPRAVEEDTQRMDMNVDFPMREGGTQRRMNYAWPLEVGKKWNYEYTVNSMGKNGQPVTIINHVSAEVAGWESVTTPAGTFRTLKIVHKGTMEMPGYPSAGRVGWTFWYAPEVGSQVKYTYQWDSSSGTPGTRTTSVLTSYKRGGN